VRRSNWHEPGSPWAARRKSARALLSSSSTPRRMTHYRPSSRRSRRKPTAGTDVGLQATRFQDLLRGPAPADTSNIEVVDPARGLPFLKEQLCGVLLEQTDHRQWPEHGLAPPAGISSMSGFFGAAVERGRQDHTLGKWTNPGGCAAVTDCLIAAANLFPRGRGVLQQVTVWGERSGVPEVIAPSAQPIRRVVWFDLRSGRQAKGTNLVLSTRPAGLRPSKLDGRTGPQVRRIIRPGWRLRRRGGIACWCFDDRPGVRMACARRGLRPKARGHHRVGLITKLDGRPARRGPGGGLPGKPVCPIRFVGRRRSIGDLAADSTASNSLSAGGDLEATR